MFVSCLFTYYVVVYITGSHKEVRSMASVSLRMFAPGTQSNHFDYFTVSLNGELSGLYGGVLHNQATYVSLCIQHVLSLYNQSPRPSVFLLGHSAGGIVAKYMLGLPDVDLSAVNTILTLGTPNAFPVLSLDEHLVQVTVSADMAMKRHNSLLVMAIGGGIRDRQVRSGLTRLPKSYRRLSMVSTALAHVWVTVDHNCLVWCKQMVINFNRALFQLIDANTHQLVINLDYRVQHWKRWLLHPKLPALSNFAYKVVVEITYLPWSLPQNRATSIFFQYQLTNLDTSDVIIVISNIPLAAWIYGCSLTDSLKPACHNASSLDHTTLPPSYGVVKMALFEARHLAAYSHLGVWASQATHTKLGTSVFAKLYTTNKSIYHNFYVPIVNLWSSHSVNNGEVYAVIRLHGLEHIWQVYTITAMQDANCSEQNGVPLLLQKHVPWYHEDEFSPSGGNVVNLTIRLQSARAPGSRQVVELRLYKDPDCDVLLNVRVDFMGVLGQLMRFYASLLVSLTLCILLVKCAISSTFVEQSDVNFALWWVVSMMLITTVWLFCDVFAMIARILPDSIEPNLDWREESHSIVLTDITWPVLVFMLSVSWSIAAILEFILYVVGYLIAKIVALIPLILMKRLTLVEVLSVTALMYVPMFELALVLAIQIYFIGNLSSGLRTRGLRHSLCSFCVLIGMLQMPAIIAKLTKHLWTWTPPTHFTIYTVARIVASICLLFSKKEIQRKSLMHCICFLLGAMLIVLYCACSLHRAVIVLAILLLCDLI